jgi:putative transcriptional regulator
MVTLLAVVALAWPAAVGADADKEPAVGRFLVASRDLSDPNFEQTVVLLLDYGPEGAMGLVVNRPTKASVSQVLPRLEEVQDVNEVVYMGGPVDPESVMMLLRSPNEFKGSRRVFEDIHFSQNADLLRRFAAAESDDTSFRIYVGYSGWGPGQLESEIEAGGWLVVDADSELVMTEEPSATWRRLIPAPRSLQARSDRRSSPSNALLVR